MCVQINVNENSKSDKGHNKIRLILRFQSKSPFLNHYSCMKTLLTFQELCQIESDCAMFSFETSETQNVGNCILKTHLASSTDRTSTGVISGLKFCPLEYEYGM